MSIKKTQGLVVVLILAMLLIASCGQGTQVTTLEKGTPTVAKDDPPDPQDTAVPKDGSELHDAITAMGFQLFDAPVQMPEFALGTPQGPEVAIGTWKGSWYLLNFWATWCPPCRAEMPSMEVLHRDYQGRGFSVVAINAQEETKIVNTFLAENPYSFPILLDSTGKISAMFGIESIPTSFLVNPRGEIVGGMIGTQEWDTPGIRKALDTILKLGK